MKTISSTIKLSNGTSEVKCPDTVLDKSNLLQHMMSFCDEKSESIKIPQFITRSIISDIVKALENLDNNYLVTFDLMSLLQIFEASDFLDISELTDVLFKVIIDKLSSDNCFELFQMSKKSMCFKEINDAIVKLIIKLLTEYYEELPLSATYIDPYYNRYKFMTFCDIEYIIDSMNSSFTVTKIFIIRNWLQMNERLVYRLTFLRRLDRVLCVDL